MSEQVTQEVINKFITRKLGWLRLDIDFPEYLYLLTCNVDDELISISIASRVSPADVLDATLGRKS